MPNAASDITNLEESTMGRTAQSRAPPGRDADRGRARWRRRVPSARVLQPPDSNVPLVVRGLTVGAAVAGVVGGVAGGVIGLVVHPATAWFAVFELGVPASVLGAVVGAAAGAATAAVRRARRHPDPAEPVG
jgi:hypothetical protein